MDTSDTIFSQLVFLLVYCRSNSYFGAFLVWRPICTVIDAQKLHATHIISCVEGVYARASCLDTLTGYQKPGPAGRVSAATMSTQNGVSNTPESFGTWQRGKGGLYVRVIWEPTNRKPLSPLFTSATLPNRNAWEVAFLCSVTQIHKP